MMAPNCRLAVKALGLNVLTKHASDSFKSKEDVENNSVQILVAQTQDKHRLCLLFTGQTL